MLFLITVVSRWPPIILVTWPDGTQTQRTTAKWAWAVVFMER